MWRMTVQEPDTSMWKPRSRSSSSVRSFVGLGGDAKNCEGHKRGRQRGGRVTGNARSPNATGTTHGCSCRRVNEVRPVAGRPQGEAHLLRSAHKLQGAERGASRRRFNATSAFIYQVIWGLTLRSSWSLSCSAASSHTPLLCVTVTTVMDAVGAEGNMSSRSVTERCVTSARGRQYIRQRLVDRSPLQVLHALHVTVEPGVTRFLHECKASSPQQPRGLQMGSHSRASAAAQPPHLAANCLLTPQRMLFKLKEEKHFQHLCSNTDVSSSSSIR
ncbi:hypothetical protein EYF80_023514 [Liparis tanakae]|uniref:Uncharacterized protein n=1 Tax=Liparis tanakae TaxID=230148 RepID=A0A4Z2HL57_9TELE|nr:hypothetical protein EYF80_023514 [Liparis tanakae]